MIAIDLGSNTIRFIEFDGQKWGKSFEKIVRTAESLHETRKVGDRALGRVIEAIGEADKIFDFRAHDIVAMTTAAVRMATNGVEFLATIKEQTGIAFEIIDGEREAKLTLGAVLYRLQHLCIAPNDFVLADIGGGSTELIFYSMKLQTSTSIPMGIVTMSEKASQVNTLSLLLEHFEDEVRGFSQRLSHRSKTLVLTAGTPTTIAAYQMGMDYNSYDPVKINGSFLTLQACYETYDELMAMSEDERSKYVGVGREGLIATGILMVVKLFEGLNCQEAIVIDDGLREGIALDYFSR
jgi:exopolyphosphatase/guanosine-5'-triphosphate,3'-diphosphate pyrophosphatase